MVEGSNTLKMRLGALVNVPGNDSCCDCSKKKPTWVSLIVIPADGRAPGKYIGAFYCNECSSIHKALGTQMCFPKSIELTKWGKHEYEAIERGGNKRVNNVYETRVPNNEKISSTATVAMRENYIRMKYEDRKYYDKQAWSKIVESSGSPKSTAIPVSTPTSDPLSRTCNPRPRMSRRNSMPDLEPQSTPFGDSTRRYRVGAREQSGVHTFESSLECLMSLQPENAATSWEQPNTRQLERQRSFRSSNRRKNPNHKDQVTDLRGASCHFPLNVAADCSEAAIGTIVPISDAEGRTSRRLRRRQERRRSRSPTNEQCVAVPDLFPPLTDASVNDRNKFAELGESLYAILILNDTPELTSRVQKGERKERGRRSRKLRSGRRSRSNSKEDDGTTGSSSRSFHTSGSTESSVSEADAMWDSRPKRRPLFEDSLRELVGVLDQEDQKGVVSQHTNRRILERRRSLSNLSQEEKPDQSEAAKLTPDLSLRDAEVKSRRDFIDNELEKHLANILSPEEQKETLDRLTTDDSTEHGETPSNIARPSSEGDGLVVLSEHTCMLSPYFDTSGDFFAPTPTGKADNTRGSKARRASMPRLFPSEIGTPGTEASDIISTIGEERPRLRRMSAGSLQTRLAKMAPVPISTNPDSGTIVSEHSDIISVTQCRDRRSQMIRRNSLPNVSENKPQGQLSTFLDSLLGKRPTNKAPPAPIGGNDMPPRVPTRWRRRRAHVKPHGVPSSHDSVDSDIQSTDGSPT